MYLQQPKKMLIVLILEALKKHTDKNHPISQKELLQLLKDEYNIEAERKSIRRNLTTLIDYGFNIEFTEIERASGKDENTIYTNIYYQSEFDESELRLLIDSIIFSKSIPKNQVKKLVKKLENLTSKNFRSNINKIETYKVTETGNKQLFYNIEILVDAIKQNKKISFNYCSYDIEKKLMPRLTSDGKARLYLINPYQVVAADGRYYIICNNDKYENLSHYRIDRITNIKLIEKNLVSMKELQNFESMVSLENYLNQHINMFTGSAEKVELIINPILINEVLERFGFDCNLEDAEDGQILVSLKASLDGIKRWVLQHTSSVLVKSPSKLIEMIKEDLKESLNKYQD